MRRRSLALVLALIVAGAPQVLAACRLACVAVAPVSMAHGNHRDAAHSRHPSTPAAAVTIRPDQEACDHSEQVSEAARPSTALKSAPVFGTGAPGVTPHLIESSPGRVMTAEPVRNALVVPVAPLRI